VVFDSSPCSHTKAAYIELIDVPMFDEPLLEQISRNLDELPVVFAQISSRKYSFRTRRFNRSF
jgi:hypothetical protein